jgi:hypothetical protein
MAGNTHGSQGDKSLGSIYLDAPLLWRQCRGERGEKGGRVRGTMQPPESTVGGTYVGTYVGSNQEGDAAQREAHTHDSHCQLACFCDVSPSEWRAPRRSIPDIPDPRWSRLACTTFSGFGLQCLSPRCFLETFDPCEREMRLYMHACMPVP